MDRSKRVVNKSASYFVIFIKYSFFAILCSENSSAKRNYFLIIHKRANKLKCYSYLLHNYYYFEGVDLIMNN